MPKMLEINIYILTSHPYRISPATEWNILVFAQQMYICIYIYMFFTVIDSSAAFPISNLWSQLTLESAITPVAKDTIFELLYVHEKITIQPINKSV